MWRSALLLGALAAVMTAAGVALADGSAEVRVAPRHGGVHRTFIVGFTAPAPAGAQGVMSRSYSVSAERGRGTGCTWSMSRAVSDADTGQRVHVYLKPDGAWCRGLFKGTVTMTEGPNCSAGPPCPLFATRITTLGRFSFRVR